MSTLSSAAQPRQQPEITPWAKLTPPTGELMLGQTIDLNRSQGFSKWLEQLPDSQLALTDLEVVEQVENTIDQNFAGGLGKYIHIGRNRLELVSNSEADLFRNERRLEDASRKSLSEDLRGPVDPALAECMIIGGLSNPELSSGIATRLGLHPSSVLFGQFASSESRVAVRESARDKRVFIIQSICDPVNEHVMETNLLIDALRRASAAEINVVVPLYGYARQDRKGDERAPVSAQLFAKLLKASGADRLITVDVHSAQTEGFFDGPLDNLFASPIIISHLVEKYGDDKLIVVGADEGQFKRLIPITPEIQTALGPARGKDLAIAAMSKIRTRPGEVEDMRFVGNPDDVRGRTALLWDDMGDTLGTIIKGAELVRELGAARVVVILTHMLGSFNGIERLRNTYTEESTENSQRLVDEVICTNTVPLRRGRGDLITVLPIEELLAESILRICRKEGDSLRELRKYANYQASGEALLH